MGLLITFVLGIFVLIGAAIAGFAKNEHRVSELSVAVALGAIVMLLALDLVPEVFEGIEHIGWLLTVVAVVLGFAALAALDRFLPDADHGKHGAHGHVEDDDAHDLAHAPVVSGHPHGSALHVSVAVVIALTVHNIIEGVVKVAIFLGYLILCSRQKDVHRVFCYHGAEHKTIFCYEAGLPLTVENVRPQPKHHPRCGTSFLFVVIMVSILVSSLVFPYINWQNIWVRIGVKLLLLIPVVGVTYEFNRFVGAHDNAVTRILSAPGMWMQNFTTNEPDDSMIEVAIEAMKLVIPAEKGKDQW